MVRASVRMGDISKHFFRSEFACKCGCGQDTVDAELLTVLERVRTHFDAVIVINSGNRCPKYNKKIGGSKNSQHIYSRAADHVVHGVNPRDVQEQLDDWYPGRYGIGSYETFTHIDTRGYRARWSG
jgi:uncharacterized protein YcbK (DUF882 family)